MVRNATLWQAACAIGALMVLLSTQAIAQTRWHVNGSLGSNGNGLTWGTAYNNLQSALDAADPGDEIWVAEGTYYPSVEFALSGSSTPRNKTFRLVSGVKMYGGFIGTETSLPQRNPELNETILSGEINDCGTQDDAFHVVFANDVDENTMLNGFVITGGYAAEAEPTGPDDAHNGGGLLITASGMEISNPQIVRCKFIGNTAEKSGGAVSIHWTDAVGEEPPVRFVNCTFVDNVCYGDAVGDGGAAAGVHSARTTFTNCVFLNNTGMSFVPCYLSPSEDCSAGAVVATCFLGFALGAGCPSPQVRFENCTLSNNSLLTLSASANTYPVFSLVNSIAWNEDPNSSLWRADPNTGDNMDVVVNYSNIQWPFVYPGTGNINADPLFCNPGIGILRLSDGSPCIDAGLDAAVPPDVTDVNDNANTTEVLPWDRIRSSRFFDAISGGQLVDMGAFENPRDPECPWDLDHSGAGDVVDMAIAVSCYGSECEKAPPAGGISCCAADFNCDGTIDLGDLAVIAGGYGEPCGGESLMGGSSYSEFIIDEAWVEWAREATHEELDAWLEAYRAAL